MILNRLRLETHAQHEALDHHPLMVQLMSPTLSRTLYQHILGKFLGFYQPLEPLLARYTLWPSLGIDLTERRKTPWLLADLSHLQVPLAARPCAPQPDWIHDDAAALGTFYVMEGSTLGGQVIARHVARCLGLSRDQGLAFFSSYGEAVGTRWKETRAALVQFAEQTGEEDAMIEAARRTFEALSTWLDTEDTGLCNHALQGG
ncbi:biliverdin-producing heme oxygenase [Oligoflexus tunisiensis]|uniref:biliverdin-producing heme oxygenase n=1 Tax=Oligoflexus tunisiensis TaxID=708132 RepID=UPI000ABCD51D|nr:biliverdin-producing heme oxygenase [Oligoflexus tunisiensis]